MIVLDLSCEKQHRFEGWFASRDAFETQSRSGLVECPVCGSQHVERLPSAPYVNIGAAPLPVPTRSTTPAPTRPAAASAAPPEAQAIAAMRALLRMAAAASEDVGERFPDEARRIHHGDAEARAIRGKASGDDIVELLEEGIMVLPVPADEDVH